MKARPSDHREQERIEAAASEWLVRRGDAAQAVESNDEFYAWLEADPRHGEAYDALALVLEDVGQLRDLAALPDQQPHLKRRGLLMAAGCAAAAALLAIAVMGPAPGLEYATATGQTRAVTLADGSIVTLSAGSAIKVRMTGAGRRVELERGEAFFDVAHDAAHPFYVDAGVAQVRVLGTKFDVHRAASGVRVSVQQGRVEVRDARALTLTSPAISVLHASEATEVQTRPAYVAIAAAPLPVEQVAAAAPGAWREGRLTYDDVRLADVASDINRYYAPGVELTSPETADIRVTAAFRVNEIPAFLDALAATLPVTVTRNPNGGYRLAATQRRP
jgi:transmembrane sensor